MHASHYSYCLLQVTSAHSRGRGIFKQTNGVSYSYLCSSSNKTEYLPSRYEYSYLHMYSYSLESYFIFHFSWVMLFKFTTDVPTHIIIHKSKSYSYILYIWVLINIMKGLRLLNDWRGSVPSLSKMVLGLCHRYVSLWLQADVLGMSTSMYY